MSVITIFILAVIVVAVAYLIMLYKQSGPGKTIMSRRPWGQYRRGCSSNVTTSYRS